MTTAAPGLTPEQLAALPGMLEKATPGPWRIGKRSSCEVREMSGARVCTTFTSVMSDYKDEVNAALIALAPDLAAEVIRLRAREAKARSLLDGWSNVAVHCDITDGMCCCGDDMKGHANPMDCGHSPVDHGAHVTDALLMETDEFLKGPLK